VSARQLDLLFENSADTMAIHDCIFEGNKVVDFRFVRVNKQYKRMAPKIKVGIGNLPAEVTREAFKNITGKRVTELVGTAFSESDVAWMLEQVNCVMRERSSAWHFEYTWSNGIAIDGFLYLISDKTFVASYTDRTEQMILEQKLQRTQRMEGLVTMASGVAHDLNNLLQVVFANMQLAQDRLGEENAVTPLLRDAEIAARNAAHLAQQLLAFSGSGTLMTSPVDLNTVVSEMFSVVRHFLGSNTELVLDISKEVLLISADSTQLRQIVMYVSSYFHPTSLPPPLCLKYLLTYTHSLFLVIL